MKSFLTHIQEHFGDGVYAGDEYGGAGGRDGSGQPTDSPGNFLFATGIECSNPTIDHGRVRRDLLEECGHYAHWQQDLGLVRELGLRVLRYGLPIHKIFRGPGRYDWEFADLVLNEMRRLDIVPILDLLHFGLPDWLGNFQNPELPVHFAAYAGAVARRYPWVRYYTPVNEIYVTVRASAKDGIWNEQLTSDRAFVTAMKHTVAASIMATQQIARHRPNCIIVQSESTEYLHEVCARETDAVRLHNKLRFLSLDLLYAHSLDSEVLLYCLDNGLTRRELDWFMLGEPPGHQIIGTDYYGRNERIIKPNGQLCAAEDVLGWYTLTKQYYQRYHKPVMHTETNTFDVHNAECWLWKQWLNILKMRQDGTPVLGFTWYSLIDQIDWDVSLSEKRGTVNPCGLFDLDRRIRPVGENYKMLIQEFGQITVVPHGELFEITSRPATLKVEV